MTKEQFLADQNDWCNHRELLYPALEATKHLGLPVLELGSGPGSTPYLRQYCKFNGLNLISYDFSEEWASKMNVTHVTNWDNIPWRLEYGVVLVDESPGEHRKESLKKLIHCKIVVIHDSEPPGWNGGDYQVRPEFSRYKYQHDLQAEKPKAWASALSNFIDLSTIYN
jgi:hypothetical protein